jgi:hypothetical protein
MPHLLRKIRTSRTRDTGDADPFPGESVLWNKDARMNVLLLGDLRMPRRTKPQGKPRMSREALEALAVSVARRIDGLDAVSLAITPMERDDAGRNWDVFVAAEVPSHDVCTRVRDALAPWRDRFDLVS